jgi:uncharacterized protein YndB with AHSA1/START domain
MMMYGPLGTLTNEAGTNVITFTRMFNAPPDQVWEALTTVEGITSWLAFEAAIDARAGGSVEISFDGDQIVTGTITQWNPHSDFAHTWIINGEIPSAVRYQLEPTGGGTTLTLIHSQLPDDMVGGYTPGWHAYMARLTAVIEAVDIPEWMTVFETVAPDYA